MIESDTKAEKPEFLSIPVLLDRGIKVSQLADAIETSGLQGWDRFGRFRSFEPDKEECKNALAFLASQHDWDLHDSMGQHDTMSPLDMIDGDEKIFRLGWSQQKLPDFDRIAIQSAAAPVEPKKPQQQRKENTDVALAAALYDLLKNGYKFESQNALAAEIATKFDWPGLSESNVSARFTQYNLFFEQNPQTANERRATQKSGKK